MRFLAGAVIAALLAGAALGADALKIYISADVEGIGGVNTWDLQVELLRPVFWTSAPAWKTPSFAELATACGLGGVRVENRKR